MTPDGVLLLAGTPALALRALDTGFPKSFVYASKSDDPVTSRLQQLANGNIHFVDIRDNLRAVQASVAIVDPPWYDDIALPLVTHALRGVKLGGAILIGVPDRLSGCHWAELLTSIADNPLPFGLAHARISNCELRYETPLFELNTLVRLGIGSAHPQWRTGRLAFARKTSAFMPIHSFPPLDWREVRGANCRLRFRGELEGASRTFVTPFGVRDTVSRSSDWVRTDVYWTAGNRVAYVAGQREGDVGQPLNTVLDQLEKAEIAEARKLLNVQEDGKNVMDKVQIRLHT
ncbi:hypothetical protein ACQ86E_11795 [Bradyrhizobium betae]|uniref:hypothetical protein n=1 Tax=Bradyrhizobium betae TaxID=244734 RepID=UPI003D66AF18